MTPNNKQVRFLKTLCHPLSPIVRIGQKGLTDSVSSELEIAIAHHELVKIKVAGDKEERREIIAALAEKSNAHIIQQVGQIAVLFRRNHEKPVIEFPASTKAKAKNTNQASQAKHKS